MAETFGMTKSNLSHLLNKLQEMKLVTRKVHAEDFRRQQVSLTVLGEKTCQRLIRYFNRMQDRLEESFGDAESLKRFNKKIRALSEMN
jgi:DNA-binding MarR family transcriptional regulator